MIFIKLKFQASPRGVPSEELFDWSFFSRKDLTNQCLLTITTHDQILSFVVDHNFFSEDVGQLLKQF